MGSAWGVLFAWFEIPPCLLGLKSPHSGTMFPQVLLISSVWRTPCLHLFHRSHTPPAAQDHIHPCTALAKRTMARRPLAFSGRGPAKANASPTDTALGAEGAAEVEAVVTALSHCVVVVVGDG